MLPRSHFNEAPVATLQYSTSTLSSRRDLKLLNNELIFSHHYFWWNSFEWLWPSWCKIWYFVNQTSFIIRHYICFLSIKRNKLLTCLHDYNLVFIVRPWTVWYCSLYFHKLVKSTPGITEKKEKLQFMQLLCFQTEGYFFCQNMIDLLLPRWWGTVLVLTWLTINTPAPHSVLQALWLQRCVYSPSLQLTTAHATKTSPLIFPSFLLLAHKEKKKKNRVKERKILQHSGARAPVNWFHHTGALTCDWSNKMAFVKG